MSGPLPGGYLGSRRAVVKLSTTADANPYGIGLWMATLDAATFGQGSNNFVIYHQALQGPVGSALLVYTGATFYDTTPRGDINSWDANSPLYMVAGLDLYYYWNSSKAPSFTAQPIVTVWMRQPGSTL